MTALIPADPLRPVDALHALIARHGLLRIILALPSALIRQRRTRPVLGHTLSPHLQRDIGMAADRSRYPDLR